MLKTLRSKLRLRTLIVTAIAFFVAIVLPIALLTPSSGLDTAIVTAIGIDKQDDNIDIALQIVSPNPKSEPIVSVIESKGENLHEALKSVQTQLGKNIGLEHCAVIAFGQIPTDSNIQEDLELLYKSYKVNLNTAIIVTKDKTKDLLSATSEVRKNLSNSIQNNLSHNKNTLSISSPSTIGQFYNNNKNKGAINILPVLEKIEPPEEGAEPNAPIAITNLGYSAVFLDGKFVEIIPPDLTFATNLLKSNKSGFYEGKKLETKKVCINRKIENNKYLANINITIDTTLDKAKLKDKIENAWQYCLDNDLDLFRLEDGFYRHKNKSYNKLNKPFLPNTELIVNIK